MHVEKKCAVIDPVRKRLTYLLAVALAELTDDPAPIRIDADQNGTTITLRVLAPQAEIGKIIGVNGRMARCLRTLMGSAARKHKRICCLDILPLETEPNKCPGCESTNPDFHHLNCSTFAGAESVGA